MEDINRPRYKFKKWLSVIILATVLLIAGYWLYSRYLAPNEPESNASAEMTEAEEPMYSVDEPGSLWWVVNKQRPLPEDYVPPSMAAPDMKLRWASDAESMQVSTQAIADLQAMDKAATKAGLKLMLVSAYRSESYQKQLYNGYVRSSGQDDADRFSARPGTSEHQTGLAVDLGRVDGECEIEECFSETKEGKWLAANAHKYGFILRYLENKEEITGYLYEPWHFRYVGKELAAKIHDTGQTLEEYFELGAAPDYPSY